MAPFYNTVLDYYVMVTTYVYICRTSATNKSIYSAISSLLFNFIYVVPGQRIRITRNFQYLLCF